MDKTLDILFDAGKDTLVLVPFLLFTYIVLEILEHLASNRANALVRRAGVAGPAVGALLGVVPQCGFSAVAATLYAGRVITIGSLFAVFLSTSDEMLPMFIAEQIDPVDIVRILGIKVLIALVMGFVVDLFVRILRSGDLPARLAGKHSQHDKLDKNQESAAQLIESISEAGEGAEHIHQLCEQDHCACGHADKHHDHGSITLASAIRSAIHHTVQVTVFIFIVSLALGFVLEFVGEEVLTNFLSANTGAAVVFSALVGLVPNCSASVIITQLYLEGVLNFGPLMAGLLASAGVGYLVLFRTNRRSRENIIIVVGLFVTAVVCGLVLSLLA